jgi:hypothetical protein
MSTVVRVAIEFSGRWMELEGMVKRGAFHLVRGLGSTSAGD